MNNSLLKKLVLPAAIAAVLQGCSGGDEGLDLNFDASQPVTFTEGDLEKTYEEDSGVVQINLLEGAMEGTSSVESSDDAPVFIRQMQFSTPSHSSFAVAQSTDNGLDSNSQLASPFRMAEDGVTLLVDTNAFNTTTNINSLRACDTSDNWGAKNEENEDIGDGLPDNPSSMTFEVTYFVDNGYKFPPSGATIEADGVQTPVDEGLPDVDGNGNPTSAVQRTLTITINASSDPVMSVNASDLTVPVFSEIAMTAATSPAYACNTGLTYSIADTNIALVDDAGMVTGVTEGETEITISSVENPSLTVTKKVFVVPAFNLVLTNQDYDELNAPLGTKEVPTCSPIGMFVEPRIEADELQGAYAYSWMSANTDVVFEESISDGNFGAMGRFTNGLADGETAALTVSYESGYIGSTPADKVLDQVLTVTAQSNIACDPANVSAYNTDLAFSGKGLGAWRSAPNATSAIVDGGLDGNGALQITNNTDGEFAFEIVQQIWNNGLNYYSANLTPASAVGSKYKFSVWAKLGQVPADGTTVTLNHRLLSWNCDGCAAGSGFDGKFAAGGGALLSADLKPTTDWQFVEFTSVADGSVEWTVPSNWGQGGPGFAFWGATGMLTGETIMLDSYGIVSAD